MNNRIKYLTFFIALLLVGVIISCSDSSDTSTSDISGSTGISSNSNCPTKTCGDFKTQSQAQAAFNTNKSCYKNLDSDSDGIACENLPKN